jgi:hypothetical protein
MKTILIPLGTVVMTDARLSIAAFQKIANNLRLDINIADAVPMIFTLLQQYNHGGCDEATMVANLLNTIKYLMARNIDAKPVPNWEEQWMLQWQDAWNAMCIIDDNTGAIFAFLAQQPQVIPYFYSYTNPTHYAHVAKQLAAFGVKPDQILTSFQAHKPVAQVVGDFIAAQNATEPNSVAAIFIANPEHIKVPALKADGMERRDELLAVLPPVILKAEIMGARLDPNGLYNVLRQVAKNAASPKAAAVPQPGM